MHKRKETWHFVRKMLSFAPAVLFLLFIFGMMVKTTNEKVIKTLNNTTYSLKSFINLSNSFEKTLQDQCYEREFFYNLNGLTTRMLDIKSLNERQRMKNGFLYEESDSTDITYPLEQLTAFDDFLDKENIDFLFIMSPTTSSIYDAQFASGYEDKARNNLEQMMSALSEADVSVIDADALFEENGLHTEDVLFKTDHHWTPEGAFFITHKSLQYMRDYFGIMYDDSMADYANWDVATYENYFLGSHGKRVGSKYVGADDISIIRRKGQESVAFSCLHKNTTNWDYRNSTIDEVHLREKDYFHLNPYSAYLGGDYPLAIIKNNQALNDKRIVVIGNSFRLPVETFLTSYFTELYHLDIRYYTDGTAAQFIKEIQPDIVLMCMYEKSLSEQYQYQFSLGTEKYYASKAAIPDPTEAISLGDFYLDAKENNAQFQVVFSNLKPDTPYTLTIENADILGGEDAYVQMTLQDLSDNKAVCNRYFEVDRQEPQRWLFTTGEEDHTYAIYVYAGTKDHTAGVSSSVEGVRLQAGFP